MCLWLYCGVPLQPALKFGYTYDTHYLWKFEITLSRKLSLVDMGSPRDKGFEPCSLPNIYCNEASFTQYLFFVFLRLDMLQVW